MSLFGAIVKTAVNVVKLPISLPVAAIKDAKHAVEEPQDAGAHELRALVREIKEDADA